MTTSTEPATAAIERGDADWLTANVDGTACSMCARGGRQLRR